MLVPGLSATVNNLYSISEAELQTQLDEATRKHLTDVARVDGYTNVSSATVLVYVGGNENCEVGRAMRSTYSIKKMYVLEPFPPFFKKLQALFAGPEGEGVTLLNYGLGDVTTNVTVQNRGKATATASVSSDECSAGSCEVVHIKDTVETLLPIIAETASYEHMLYANCEGCEVPMLERLLDSGLVRNFKHIHFASHVEGTLHYIARVCRIRERLAATHEVVFGLPYAQERYVRKYDLGR